MPLDLRLGASCPTQALIPAAAMAAHLPGVDRVTVSPRKPRHSVTALSLRGKA